MEDGNNYARTRATPKAGRRRGPRPAISVQIELPIPPAAAARSAEFAAWRDAAALKLAAEDLPRISGCVSIRLRAGLADARHMHQAVTHAIELLAKHEVIASTAAATDLSARWDRSVEPGRMTLCVRQTRRPEQRPSLLARRRVSAQQSERWLRFREGRSAA